MEGKVRGPTITDALPSHLYWQPNMKSRANLSLSWALTSSFSSLPIQNLSRDWKACHEDPSVYDWENSQRLFLHVPPLSHSLHWYL